MTPPVPNSDETTTRRISLFAVSPSTREFSGYFVRIHPVDIGEGIISIPFTTLVIGRDGSCGLVLDDKDVSRQHAVIQFKGNEYTISDLGSTNGIMVNDQKVERAALVSGDLLRLGKTILKFLRGNNVEKQYHETVYAMMINDGLTGIPNKRFFLEALNRELTRSQRHNRPLSLAVLDIDHFKQVNDKYGHLAGDCVLRELAARVRSVIRKDEVFARYGGEEFVVLLPESTLEDARQFAERIRELASGTPVKVADLYIAVTVSIGIAHTAGEGGLTPEEFFEKADRKLYDAKASGRNRVVC